MIKVERVAQKTDEIVQYVTRIKFFGIPVYVSIDQTDLDLVPHEDSDKSPKEDGVTHVTGFKLPDK